jgi:predicted nucleotidyltransferase component of viral defense system
MDPNFQKQVHLLLRILPEIAKEEAFALHGGTAINLFFHEMPRLSVDIDLTWIPYSTREEDLKQIREKLISVSLQIRKSIPAIQIREPVSEDDELKLYCLLSNITVKIEVNTINRGLLALPVKMPLCVSAQKIFDSYCEVQTVPFSQLYGGKLVAALDRQHPRDLFDCWKLLKTTGYTSEIHKGFLFCLLSSKRPVHEILSPRFIDQRSIFKSHFSGMTDEPFTYETFEEVRMQIQAKILTTFNIDDKEFLLSFLSGDPDWHDKAWEHFPGIRWKLLNINKLKSANPTKHFQQLHEMKILFGL